MVNITFSLKPSRTISAHPHGLSLVELIFVMTILAGAFAGIFFTMNLVARGMYSETVNADQYTRVTGTLYDVVSELRETAVFSPHFYLEVNPAKPPSITFDKIDTVDADGTIVWGSTITYRLERVVSAGSAEFEAANPGITQGQVVREEIGKINNQPQPPQTSVIEESVPYQFTQNGNTAWGFNVTRDGCALALALSRFGDTHIDTNLSATDAVSGNSAKANNAISTTAVGRLAICTTRGVYFLRNPQAVIPAE